MMLSQKVLDFIGGNPVIKSYSKFKVKEVLDILDPGTKVLIVFWHGLGDTLMFLPVYKHLESLKKDIKFNLALGPGFGQSAVYPEALDMPEAEFTKNNDIAFVLSFGMVEGSNNITKAEYCCQKELGIELPKGDFYLNPLDYGGENINKFVAVHFHGTCLPGSTNPDEELAKRIWNDITEAGYIPIDVHFKHVFHNPANKDYSWVSRTCRDLKPDINQLRNVIGSCMAFVGVASGPFVLSLTNFPLKTIYLQKHHNINCYVRNLNRVVDILNYDKEVLLKHLNDIPKQFN
jgi:hypothetical protein